MAKNDVRLRKAETILAELDELQRAINQRAFDLFKGRGELSGSPVADWLDAERELVWKPAVELRQKDGQFEVLAATPGVEARDLNVEVTRDDLLVQADIRHEHATTEGDVHLCEFTGGRLFRSVHFPKPIDPDTVKVEYRNGLLRVTANVSKAGSTKVRIKAA